MHADETKKKNLTEEMIIEDNERIDNITLITMQITLPKYIVDKVSSLEKDSYLCFDGVLGHLVNEGCDKGDVDIILNKRSE